MAVNDVEQAMKRYLRTHKDDIERVAAKAWLDGFQAGLDKMKQPLKKGKED